MANRIDIYGHDKAIERYKQRVLTDDGVTPANKQAILDYVNYGYSTGLSKSRISIILTRLYYLAKWLGKNFKEASKNDLLVLAAKIEQEPRYKPWTKATYRTVLKRFYKWLEGDGTRYPEKISWLKTAVRNSLSKLPEELLTQEEVRRLIDCAQNPRDKALIAVLWESGARIGEVAGIQIKHVSPNKHGMSIILYGKTGSRRVLLIFAYPHLVSWLENHPFKQDSEAPLWCALTREKRGQALNYPALRLQIAKIAERAGICKRVNPHSFRHARATQLAKLGLNEAQMSAYLGWVPATAMAGVYVHLSGRDVDDAILKAYGLKPEEKEGNVLPCFRCDTENAINSKFCQSCGTPLTLNAAIELQTKENLVEEKLVALLTVLEDPEVKQLIASKSVAMLKTAQRVE